MTIPITLILPWLLFAVTSFVFGALIALGTAYPKDLTVGRLLFCITLSYAVKSVIYASLKGWIVWT